MNITAINQAIMQGTWTNEQLGSMIDAVKWARSRLTQQNKRTMTLGKLVKFTSTRTGQTVQGTVKKVAIKYITVETNQGLWRVPANMLEVV